MLSIFRRANCQQTQEKLHIEKIIWQIFRVFDYLVITLQNKRTKSIHSCTKVKVFVLYKLNKHLLFLSAANYSIIPPSVS